jgi:hypothetical protein
MSYFGIRYGRDFHQLSPRLFFFGFVFVSYVCHDMDKVDGADVREHLADWVLALGLVLCVYLEI